MAGACVTVQVEPESVLADRSFLTTRGDPLAWLDVGDRGELAVYGAPDALLRLAAGLIATADRAERLADDQQNPAEAWGPPAAARRVMRVALFSHGTTALAARS